MKFSLRFAAVLLAACSTDVVLAQGQTCATAQAISGAGSFFFTNLGSTNDGPPACGNFGADVWFAWTSPSAGTYTFETCDADYDTTLAVYNECGGGQFACNDDACGIQSRVFVPALNGSTYVIRIGGHNGATGLGTLTITGDPAAPCTDLPAGPDVLVQELSGLSSYVGVNGVGAHALGTLMCNMGAARLVLQASGLPFAVPIPAGCVFAGQAVSSQGAAFGGSLGIRLTNALDLVIGTL